MTGEPTPAFSTSRTAGRFCLDTCVLIGRSDPRRFTPDELPALDELFDLYKQRRVMLAKTDTVDLERIDGQPEDVARARLLETMDLLEVYGILVLDHSRLDHCVLGSSEDGGELNRVIGIVHPKAKWSDPDSKNDLRDGMHIHTAIRDGYDGFVTADRSVLRAAGAMRAEWPMFSIFTPTEAVAWVRKRAASLDRWAEHKNR